MKQIESRQELIYAIESNQNIYMQSVFNETELTKIVAVYGDPFTNGTSLLLINSEQVFSLFEYILILSDEEVKMLKRRNTAINLINTYHKNINWLTMMAQARDNKFSQFDVDQEKAKLNKAIEVRNEMNQKLGL